MAIVMEYNKVVNCMVQYKPRLKLDHKNKSNDVIIKSRVMQVIQSIYVIPTTN